MSQPAWSDKFDPDRLGPVRVGLPGAITREWAWEGATGAGIRVAIVDSGIDGTHPSVGGTDGGVALQYDPESPDGVRASDKVVASGAYGLPDNTKIKIEAAEAPAEGSKEGAKAPGEGSSEQ